jgi:hypothetical protein
LFKYSDVFKELEDDLLKKEELEEDARVLDSKDIRDVYRYHS